MKFNDQEFSRRLSYNIFQQLNLSFILKPQKKKQFERINPTRQICKYLHIIQNKYCLEWMGMRERNQQIEQDVRQSLFKLPNEEEIESEIQEVDRLKKLDEEFKLKKQELERQRAKINITKLEKIDSEQKRLASRLEQLVNTPQENDQEEIYKLIALKRKIAESSKVEMKVLEDQYLLSKEKEIEDRVRKKIQLERILEEKKQLNEKFSKIKMEVDMIQAEEEDRVMSTKKYLDKALSRNISNPLQNDAYKKGLDRAGLQNKGDDYLSDQDKYLLSKALVDQEVQDQKEKELILKEIQARREQEKRKVQLEIQEKQRALNDQRFELIEESEKLLKKKVIHHELQKKGVDFLANIEQGLAPPMEFILQNLQNVDEDQYRSESTVDEVISRAKKFSKIGRSRIEYLKQDHKDFFGYDPYDKPYNGDLKPAIQRMNPENVYISRLIIDWLIELTIRKHLENQAELAATREKQHYLQEKAKRLQKKIDTMTNSQSYVEIRDRIYNRVIDKIIREAAFEIATVNQMAKTISLNLIVRAIKGQRNSGNSEQQLSKIFYSLRNADMTKKDDPNFRFNYKDMQKIEDANTKQKKDKKSKTKDKTKDKDGFGDQDLDEEKDKEDDEDDQTVLHMYPEKECVEMLGTQDILEMEIEYWNHIALKEKPYMQHNPKKKFTITAICLSFNKEFLALGYSNGSVQIYTTPPADTVLIAQAEEVMPKRISHLEFAFDNISQLIVTDEDGNFTVNFNAQNLKNQKQQSSQDQSLVMKPYYSFNWKMLTRSGRVNTPDTLKIVYSTFHPGITFTGLQPYLMIGSEKGLIMKFNSNKDLYKGISYKFPIHNIVNSPIITFNQAEFPNEYNKTLDIVDNHNENSTKPINIFREFFVEHKSRIVSIVFLNKPDTFITIDQKGYIFYWVYEKDQFLVKLDGYFPKSKYRVSSQVMTYIPKTEEDKQLGPNIVKIDLNINGKSKDEGGKQKFREIISGNETYEKDLVYLKYNQSESLKHIAEVVVAQNSFPTEQGQDVIFYRGRVNFKEQKFESLSEERYVSQLVDGQVMKCQPISGNKYIVIQQILPHKLDLERAYVQFVRFDTNLFRLKKVKIQLETPDVDDIDFSIIEDFGPFGTPYIFILMRQGLYVASLATGTILFDFKNHLTIIQQETKLNQDVVANHIKNVLDLYLIIASNDSNGAYIFNIEDSNDDNQRKEVLSNRTEYKRLYAV